MLNSFCDVTLHPLLFWVSSNFFSRETKVTRNLWSTKSFNMVINPMWLLLYFNFLWFNDYNYYLIFYSVFPNSHHCLVFSPKRAFIDQNYQFILKHKTLSVFTHSWNGAYLFLRLAWTIRKWKHFSTPYLDFNHNKTCSFQMESN